MKTKRRKLKANERLHYTVASHLVRKDFLQLEWLRKQAKCSRSELIRKIIWEKLYA